MENNEMTITDERREKWTDKNKEILLHQKIVMKPLPKAYIRREIDKISKIYTAI